MNFKSLSGQTSSVECVRFSADEELLAAGSQSGTLKIWDLEAAKSKFHHGTSVGCRKFGKDFITVGCSFLT